MTATRPPGYDDRSAAPVEASRRGAHRARPKPIAAILPVIAGVAVVLLVIGAVYTVFGSSADTPETNTAAQEAVQEEADSTADTDSDSDSADATTSSKKKSTKSSSSGSSGTVDQTIPVIVLNSIDVSGLAASYQTTLEGEGWSIERTGNSTSRDLATTKIYYEDSEMKASAKAVRKALGGFGELSEDADVNAGSITVVLGEDAQ